MSQAIEESEERVWRAVAARFAVQRLGAGERSFFDGEVGVQVHLRGVDLLVSEPQRDHGGVDAGTRKHESECGAGELQPTPLFAAGACSQRDPS
jgi:hypothetical protein